MTETGSSDAVGCNLRRLTGLLGRGGVDDDVDNDDDDVDDDVDNVAVLDGLCGHMEAGDTVFRSATCMLLRFLVAAATTSAKELEVAGHSEDCGSSRRGGSTGGCTVWR